MTHDTHQHTHTHTHMETHTFTHIHIHTEIHEHTHAPTGEPSGSALIPRAPPARGRMGLLSGPDALALLQQQPFPLPLPHTHAHTHNPNGHTPDPIRPHTHTHAHECTPLTTHTTPPPQHHAHQASLMPPGARAPPCPGRSGRLSWQCHSVATPPLPPHCPTAGPALHPDTYPGVLQAHLREPLTRNCDRLSLD